MQMKLSKYSFLAAALLSAIYLLTVRCAAAEIKKGGLQAVEFLTGYGYARAETQERYRIVPLCLDFDFDFNPIMEKIGVRYPGLQQFIVEPFVAPAYSPHANVEAGMDFALKFGIFPSDWTFQPYMKGAFGPMYLTQRFVEQSTQFNFNEYAAAGFHYFFTKDCALTGEFRFRHVSNGDIKRPNSGITTSMWLLGVSRFF
jgi:hypothetical protein